MGIATGAARKFTCMAVAVVLTVGMIPLASPAKAFAADGLTAASLTAQSSASSDYTHTFTLSDSGIVVDSGKDGAVTVTNAKTTAEDGTWSISKNLKLTIAKSGTYYITGAREDVAKGISIDATGVTLVLDGLTLKTTDEAPIACKKESSATLDIEGVVTLIDAENASSNGGYPDGAAIKVKSESGKETSLAITGSGTLNAVGSCKNGIKGGPCASIAIGESETTGLTVNVDAVNNGIASDGSLAIAGGTFKIVAGNDGIKSVPDTDDSASAGTVSVSGGTFDIDAVGDGIQADSELSISGGSFDIKTMGGYNDSTFNSSTMSAKGLKASSSNDDATSSDTSEATNRLTITGGEFVLNTADDAIHSDAYVSITGGEFDVKTGDDAVHADTSLTLGMEDGDDSAIHFTASNCYEGLEAGTVYVYSGCYSVTASDDGLNAAGGSDGSSSNGPGGGRDGFNGGGQPSGPGGWRGISGEPTVSSQAANSYAINISGGKIYVNASGDGIDSNGDLAISGGTVVSFSSGRSDNAYDADGTFTISGGTVFGLGGNDPRAPSATGSQTTKGWTSVGAVSAGKVATLTVGGATVVSLAVPQAISNAYWLYSSPALTSSAGCTLKVATGTAAGVPSTWAESDAGGSGSNESDGGASKDNGSDDGASQSNESDGDVSKDNGSDDGASQSNDSDDGASQSNDSDDGASQSNESDGDASKNSDSDENVSASSDEKVGEDDDLPAADVKTSIKGATVTGVSSTKVYTGSVIKPVPTVKVNGKTLKRGTDYTVAYKNNKTCGKATVTIKGMGDYEGAVTKTFIIKPMRITGVKVASKAAAKATVSWSKAKAVAAKATGYQIYYKVAGKSAKTLFVTKASTASKVLSKLAKGKKVTCKVRAYKTLSSKKYFGTWSVAKKVTVKKK